MTKIKIGLFFDGTGNNGYNAQSIKKYKDSSYHSSPTNIFRLYKNYKNVCKKDSDKIAVYVEGIGTMNYREDSTLDQALGDLPIWYGYGAKAKISYATEYIHRELVELFDRENIDENIDLEFNIFGFSRGAALARHYANQLSDTKSIVYENIKKSLDNKSKLNKIKINFLGLYDTVESFKGFDAKTSVANLKDVGCIFQLRAEHECRENFPLTSILNKQQSEKVDEYRGYSEFNKNNTSKLIEVLVPGNHSDVGGSYLDYLKEDRSVECRVFEDVCKSELKKIQENPIWTQLLDDKHIKYEHEFSGYWYWFAKSNRQEIRAQLQWIYAKLMIENAIKNNCEFDLNDFNREYDIPCDLKPIYSQLSRVIEELNDLKKCEELFQINRNTIDNITEKYIHISANWNYLTSDEGTPSTQPIKLDENLAEAQLSLDDARVYRPAKDWKREIIFK